MVEKQIELDRICTLDEISVDEYKELLARNPLPPWTPSERFACDQEWIEEHLAEFASGYPDQWLGVYNQQVIAASSNLGQVIQAAKRIGDREVTIFFVEGRLYVYQGRANHAVSYQDAKLISKQ